MAAYGLSASGFIIKRLPEILSEVVTELKTRTKEDFDLDPESATGQFINIFCERFAEIWEVEQAIYSAMYPTTAQGMALDDAVSFTGQTRLPPIRTRQPVVYYGDVNTVIPAGSLFRSSAINGNFISESDVTLTGTSAKGMVYREDFGPEYAPVNTLTRIVTLIPGLISINNPLDEPIPGRLEEKDDELRSRYKLGTYRTGGGSVPAIYAGLIDQVKSIISANVYANNGNVTDNDGRPAGAVEAIVYGGESDLIAATLLKLVAGGNSTYGNTTVITKDEIVGNPYTIKFSRPMPVYIWLKVLVTPYAEETLPTNYQDLVKDAIVNAKAANSVGKDVILQRFNGPIYNKVDGIELLTITAATTLNAFDAAPAANAYSANKVPISIRQIANFSADRITVGPA